MLEVTEIKGTTMKKLFLYIFIIGITLATLPRPVLASGWIKVTNQHVGQLATITMGVTGQQCFLDKNGQPTNESFDITKIKVLTLDVGGGSNPITFSSGSVSAFKNNTLINGTYDPIGFFIPHTPFPYNKDDVVTVTITNAMITSASKAYFFLGLVNKNYNMCINSGNIYYQFLPAISTITPTPTQSAIVEKDLQDFHPTAPSTSSSTLLPEKTNVSDGLIKNIILFFQTFIKSFFDKIQGK